MRLGENKRFTLLCYSRKGTQKPPLAPRVSQTKFPISIRKVRFETTKEPAPFDAGTGLLQRNLFLLAFTCIDACDKTIELFNTKPVYLAAKMAG